MKRNAVAAEEDVTNIYLDEFEWLIYNREHTVPAGASVYVHSFGGVVTREDMTLPEKGTREYKKFKRWQRGSIIRRLLNLLS